MLKSDLHTARIYIAGLLKSRREELKITQTALAERTNLGIQTIKRIENANFWPGLKQFLIICDELNLKFEIK